MEEVKEFVFCKKYEAHNRTFWFIYPLLEFNSKVRELENKINKKNLYIRDEICPYENYNKNMVIYAFLLNEECEELLQLLREVDNFVYFYKHNDIYCFIYEFKNEKAIIYNNFKNSRYSKMDLLTSIKVDLSVKIKYSDIFAMYSDKQYINKYAHKIYHVVKKTDSEKLKFSKWLMDIGVTADVEQMELESELKLEEEIMNYGNKI